MLARDYCKDLVTRYAAGAGVGSLVPLPGASVAITAAEVKLVADIARAYGEALTDDEALKLIALTGAKNLGVKAAGDVAAFVPLFGWIARPALFAVSVKAVGQAAIGHFEARNPNAKRRA